MYTPVLCQTLLSVWSDTFMLNHISHRSHFDPLHTSMVMLNNYMYQFFHSFPPFLTFKHYVLYKLSPIILSYLSRTTPLLSLLSIDTHSILFNTPIASWQPPILIPFSIPSLFFVVTSSLHLGACMSLDGGMSLPADSRYCGQTGCLWMEAHCPLTHYQYLVWTGISLDGGTLSICTVPESQYSSTLHSTCGDVRRLN
jgi:hypothetical protein